jgi:hypothetical protein
MTLLILIGAIAFLAVLAYDLFSDYSQWIRGERISHRAELKERIVLLTVPVLLLAVPLKGAFLWGLLLSGAMAGLLYWCLFDGLYNIMRGFPWLFTGSVDPDDAATDKLLRRYPWMQWARIGVAAALLITYAMLVS